MEQAGFQVTAVINGEEALKVLDGPGASRFSMVVTDIEMPLVDGFELTKRIRAIAAFSNLPVIALTTRVRKIDVERGEKVGFNAYLEKFNGDILLQNMDRIFGVSGQV